MEDFERKKNMVVNEKYIFFILRKNFQFLAVGPPPRPWADVSAKNASFFDVLSNSDSRIFMIRVSFSTLLMAELVKLFTFYGESWQLFVGALKKYYPELPHR